jgi:hypothetical protein
MMSPVQAAQQAPEARNCPHGNRVPISRKAKTGRYWAAWACPENVRDCKLVFVDDAEVFSRWVADREAER